MRTLSLALAACLAALACDDSSTGPAGEGELEVTLRTTGGDPDLDGYLLDVDGRVAFPVGANGKVALRVTAGSHVLELEGVAPNCEVGGGSRREVAVPTGTTALAIAVTCEATGLVLTVQSAGLDLDPNGYRVLVNGTYRTTIGASATATVTRLDPGTHQVELSDISGNCEPVGPAAQTVTVVNRELRTLAFALSCVATTGVIRVEVSTTGADQDADGYVARLSGHGLISAPIAGPSGVGFLTTVPGGTHSVNLTGVAANCTVVGEAAPFAEVAVGGLVRDTAVVSITVDCVPDSGTIHVTTTVTGDPQGAQFTVQAYCDDYYYWYCPYPSPAPALLAPDGTATLTARSGGYVVNLAPSSAQCSVTSGQGTTLQVTPGSEHEVHFDVACGPATVRVSALTTGPNPDTEYTAQVWYYDGWYYYYPNLAAWGTVAANGSETFELTPGYYWVVLEDVAANCTVVGGPTGPGFSIGAGEEYHQAFAVQCSE